jgi:hypothetical protein
MVVVGGSFSVEKPSRKASGRFLGIVDYRFSQFPYLQL